jgi:hypothetical protein
MIIADLSVDGILGLDFLVKHKAVIDIGKQQISICGRENPIKLEGCATSYDVAVVHGVSVTSRTQPRVDEHVCTSPDGELPKKIGKIGHTYEKQKVKVKNLPLKYAPVSTTDGNRGGIAKVKDKMETDIHTHVKTAFRRLPFQKQKVPRNESVWIERERMKRRKGKKQVVHSDRLKICKAQVLRGEGTELGIEYREQGSSGSPNTEMNLGDQDEDFGSSGKNIEVTAELVGGSRPRHERRTPTWLKEYVQD